jgi:hypothetical protein
VAVAAACIVVFVSVIDCSPASAMLLFCFSMVTVWSENTSASPEAVIFGNFLSQTYWVRDGFYLSLKTTISSSEILAVESLAILCFYMLKLELLKKPPA